MRHFLLLLHCLIMFLYCNICLFAQQSPVTYYALPSTYPLEIGNKWEYNEVVMTVDCTAAIVFDTTKRLYTRVEVTNKDRLFGKDLFRLKYSQIATYVKNDTSRKDTLFSYDWEQFDAGNLQLAGFDVNTSGQVTDDSKLWKISASADTSFENFTVTEQQVNILPFPLSLGKTWIGSIHAVFGELRRTVTGIDTLSLDDNILPSYKINYGYDDVGLIIHTWFSAFGKTGFNSSAQQVDNLGNPIRVYDVTNSKLVSFYSPSPPTSVKDERRENALPQNFILYQNYPNPFNPATTIEFALPASANVALRVYNILGQEVRTLVHGMWSVGTHKVVWDSRNNEGLPVSGGIYLVRLEGNNRTQVKKVVLLR